jgi:hypothetical protein
MRLLFIMASPEYLRYYDSSIPLLAERGHDVRLAVMQQKEGKPVRLEDLGMPAGVSLLGLVPKRTDVWEPMGRLVRGCMDYVRYLHPRYAKSPALRSRLVRKGLPPMLRWIDTCVGVLSGRSVDRLTRTLATFERGIPTSREIEAFLAAQEPDLVVVSPLVDVASDQVDVVRAARRRGLRVAAAIASWDNLTNKGLLRVQPDAVLVWNEAQKREASELHGVAPERVIVTGAQLFDRWFHKQPSRSLEQFTAHVGLRSTRPFVLFTGSSMFISAPDAEVAFVRRWLTAIRASADPALRDAPILIRPHPYNGWIWADADVSDFPNVAVWPRGRYNPVDPANRDDYFDSLYYSRAIVGINTSAMVEASILGRPVHSIVTEDFEKTQEGTLHFHHLLPENGGFLHLAQGLEAHVEMLARSLRPTDDAEQRTRRFVESFLRPHGIARDCTPIFVDALERIASSAPPPREGAAGTVAARLLAVLALPVARLVMQARTKSELHSSALHRSWRWMRQTRKRAAKASKTANQRLRQLRRELMRGVR